MIGLSDRARANLAMVLDEAVAADAEPGDAALVRLAMAISTTLADWDFGAPGGAPFAARAIASWPLTERWCALVAPFVDVDDDELGLAALHALRWLRVTRADRARQVEAAGALGLVWQELADAQTLSRCPTVAIRRLRLEGEVTDRTWPDLALEDRRLLWRAKWVMVDRAVMADDAGDVAPLAMSLEVARVAAQTVQGNDSRPWTWPWEPYAHARRLPVVVPSDWRPSWPDLYSLADRRTPGEVLVVPVGELLDETALAHQTAQASLRERAKLRGEVEHDPEVALPAVRRPRPTLIAVPNDPPTAEPARPAAAGGWPSSHHEWPGTAIDLEAYMRGER